MRAPAARPSCVHPTTCTHRAPDAQGARASRRSRADIRVGLVEAGRPAGRLACAKAYRRPLLSAQLRRNPPPTRMATVVVRRFASSLFASAIGIARPTLLQDFSLFFDIKRMIWPALDPLRRARGNRNPTGGRDSATRISPARALATLHTNTLDAGPTRTATIRRIDDDLPPGPAPSSPPPPARSRADAPAHAARAAHRPPVREDQRFLHFQPPNRRRGLRTQLRTAAAHLRRRCTSTRPRDPDFFARWQEQLSAANSRRTTRTIPLTQLGPDLNPSPQRSRRTTAPQRETA